MIPKSVDTLRIDINSGKVRKAVSICQQDTVQRTLNFLLVNSGNSVDLSNVLFAEILIHKADGAEADNGCVIDGDSIQYTLRTTDVSALGTNQAQLLLTFEDGQTLTTPTFEINVYSKVLNQNVQRSENEYSALTEQLVLVNEMSNQIGAARDTAIAKATEAEASATAAAESATSANAAKDNVAASATAAAESAGAAAASATLAVNAAGEADTYADNAADSAFEASQSKDNAASSATAAAASASSASTSSYTATQKASEAVDSATAAATSASNAATSEDNALDYAERAEAAYEAMGEQQLVLGETSSTAYRGDRGKVAYDHSQTTGNPHNTTAAQVGADVAGAAAQAYQQAAGYIDTQIANLINGAPSTLDTLKEIADAMAEHEDVVEALDQAIGTKASDVEFQAHQNNTTVHITAQERTKWNTTTDNVPFAFGVDENGDYGYYKAGADTVTPFKSKHDETITPNSRTTVDMGLYHKKRYVNLSAVPNENTETYVAGNSNQTVDMGFANNYRYVNLYHAWEQGVWDADNRADPNTVNYQTGYNNGRASVGLAVWKSSKIYSGNVATYNVAVGDIIIITNATTSYAVSGLSVLTYETEANNQVVICLATSTTIQCRGYDSYVYRIYRT